MLSKDSYISVSHYALSKYLNCPVSKVKRKIEGRRIQEKKEDKDYYPCIEFTNINLLRKYTRYCAKKLGRKIDFLDVGAGMGNILNLMHRNLYCSKVHGIEVEEVYYKVFKNEMLQYFFSPKRVKIFNKDAFDFEEYHKYDLIYMYVPIKYPVVMQNLHEKIIKEMKIGSFIVDVGKRIPINKNTGLIETSVPYLRRKIK